MDVVGEKILANMSHSFEIFKSLIEFDSGRGQGQFQSHVSTNFDENKQKFYLFRLFRSIYEKRVKCLKFI